ncbi:SRPBCC family protein [Chloroflexota bacterium]
MAKIEKEVTLHAPIEKIFSYISMPSNMLEFWPSLMEVKDVQPLPNGGYNCLWAYEMLGMRFKGTAQYTQMVPNQWFVIDVKGGIRSTITWTFRSMKDTTRVTLTIEYKVPIPLLGRLAEAIIVKMNDQEGTLMMFYLKARFINTKLKFQHEEHHKTEYIGFET